jgi:hypothetical protein
MVDAKSVAKEFHEAVFEFRPIIGYDRLRCSKETDELSEVA